MRVTKRENFEEAMARLGQVAMTGRRLPNQVFRFPVAGFIFVGFTEIPGDEFWTLARSLAHQSEDARITVAVLDPDPDDYFHKEFGEFGVIELAADASADEYYAELSKPPPGWEADSLDVNSELLVWFGDNGRWLIWGERSLGVAVVGCRDGFNPSLTASPPLRFLNAATALEGLISSEYRRAVPTEWGREFLSNYQT